MPKARRAKATTGGELGLIIIDYLQLMSPTQSGRRAENRQVEVAEMSRGLKLLARELETPVMALSQLNRGLELRQDKRPMLADLRESGSIENDADTVTFLYREEMYDDNPDAKGKAEAIVAKNRHGQTNKAHLQWNAPLTRFSDMAPSYVSVTRKQRPHERRSMTRSAEAAEIAVTGAWGHKVGRGEERLR